MIDSLELNIWGRNFCMPVRCEYLDKKIPTTGQENAIEQFASHPEWMAAAKKKVEDYCRERLLEEEENSKTDNIFSYIRPEYLFITQYGGVPKVALMCKYRYDLEHGLAVVFSPDGNAVVGIQDIIL